MSAVNGGIIFTGAKVAGGGGGGVTGAQNGVSLVGANVELGGILLANTSIDLAGFTFDALSGNIGIGIDTNPFSPGVFLRTGVGASGLELDGNNGFSTFGDAFNQGNQTKLSIDDAAENVQITSNSNTFFDLNIAGLIFGMGDIGSSGNGLQLQLVDSSRNFSVASTVGLIIQTDQANEIYNFGDVSGVGSGTQLSLDGLNGVIRLTSDINSGAPTQLFFNEVAKVAQIESDGTQFLIDGSVPSFQFIDGLNTFLNLNIGAGVYQIGDISTSLNGNVIVLSDTSNFLSYQSAGNEFFRIDAGTGLYQMGDIGAAALGAKFEIQDASNLVVIDNTASNLTLNFNGITLITATNEIKTGATTAGNNDPFKLGKVVAAAVAFDATRYIDVNINGVAVKIAVAV